MSSNDYCLDLRVWTLSLCPHNPMDNKQVDINPLMMEIANGNDILKQLLSALLNRARHVTRKFFAHFSSKRVYLYVNYIMLQRRKSLLIQKICSTNTKTSSWHAVVQSAWTYYSSANNCRSWFSMTTIFHKPWWYNMYTIFHVHHPIKPDQILSSYHEC